MKLKWLRIGLTAEARAALEKLAALEDRSLSYIGAKLIEEGLARKRQEKQSLPSLQSGTTRRDTRKKRRHSAEDAEFEKMYGK